MFDDSDQLIDGKWQLGKNIGSGGFASISIAANRQTGELAAVKVEDKRISDLLPLEAAILQNLCEEGVPG